MGGVQRVCVINVFFIIAITSTLCPFPSHAISISELLPISLLWHHHLLLWHHHLLLWHHHLLLWHHLLLLHVSPILLLLLLLLAILTSASRPLLLISTILLLISISILLVAILLIPILVVSILFFLQSSLDSFHILANFFPSAGHDGLVRSGHATSHCVLPRGLKLMTLFLFGARCTRVGGGMSKPYE